MAIEAKHVFGGDATVEVKKILWPTDCSVNAQRVSPYVTSLGERYQTEAYMLYVIDALAYHEPWDGEFDNTHIEKIEAPRSKPRRMLCLTGVLRSDRKEVYHFLIHSPTSVASYGGMRSLLRFMSGREKKQPSS